MNKKRFGIFIFLFAILILSVGITAAADPNKEDTCNTLCIDNNFNGGSEMTETTKCEGDGKYFRTFTDYLADGKTNRPTCCCTGSNIRLGADITKEDPFDTESGGLVEIFQLNPEGIFMWLKAFEEGKDVSTVFIKYLLLIMVFILAYSSLNIVKFPDEKALRWVLSLVLSILFTIVISPDELIAAMINFKSVGLTIILVFPIFVLAMFSFAMAVQVNAMGIVLQRVIWGIYSIFLFLNSGLVLLAGKGVAPDSIFVSLYSIANAFGGSFFTSADKTVATALFAASIIIFFTMVINNKFFIKLLIKEVSDTKLMKYAETSKKAEAKKKVDAAAIENA